MGGIQQRPRYNPYVSTVRHPESSYMNRPIPVNYQYQPITNYGGAGTPLNSTFIADNSDFDCNSSFYSTGTASTSITESSLGSGLVKDGVVLQISNLDPWYDERGLRNYLLGQLKPITPVLSLIIENPCMAKVKVPSQQVKSWEIFQCSLF